MLYLTQVASWSTMFGQCGAYETGTGYSRIHRYSCRTLNRYIIIYIHTDRQTDIQTYIQTYRHTDIQTYRQTYIHTHIQTYIHACIHTYIHIDYVCVLVRARIFSWFSPIRSVYAYACWILLLACALVAADYCHTIAILSPYLDCLWLHLSSASLSHLRPVPARTNANRSLGVKDCARTRPFASATIANWLDNSFTVVGSSGQGRDTIGIGWWGYAGEICARILGDIDIGKTNTWLAEFWGIVKDYWKALSLRG